MSFPAVSVTNVRVGANPAKLSDPFEFEVSLECRRELQEDLEWRLIYVGSAEDKTKDQELDSVSLGPVERGILQFTFVASPPDFTQVEKEEIPGITVVLLSGSYKQQEFVRIGWYLHNYFTDVPLDEQCLIDTDDMSLEAMLPKMERIILVDDPRVTRFDIQWDPLPPDEQQQQLDAAGGNSASNNDLFVASIFGPTPTPPNNNSSFQENNNNSNNNNQRGNCHSAGNAIQMQNAIEALMEDEDDEPGRAVGCNNNNKREQQLSAVPNIGENENRHPPGGGLVDEDDEDDNYGKQIKSGVNDDNAFSHQRQQQQASV